jgi:hypothetical protein
VSQISYKTCFFVRENKDIQQFILKKYDEVKSKEINQSKSYKINFLYLNGDSSSFERIDSFLINFSVNDFYFHVDRFILALFKNGFELKAINHFENLIKKKIADFNSQEIKEPKYSMILLSNYNLDCELLFNPKTRAKYVETCISSIESNALLRRICN